MLASASDILQTKLSPPPARTDRVLRRRLFQQFSTSLEFPLTLVCAPAGYGKTSLLGEWLNSDAGRAVPLAWLALDADDNDSTRFLTYLVSALDNVTDFDSSEALSSLQSPQPPPPKVILTALISRLAVFPNRFALALDDYHAITASLIHEAMIFLLDHLPPQMCLVILSREDPPFPLARLRARGQLAEIRADDLRFTSEEARAFFQQTLDTTLSVRQVTELDTRTEGWIAGLQLAALAMKGRNDIAGFISAFTGSHQFIIDYLTEEVLSRQPENLQHFLLQTSILNRLSGPLCDAVTGGTDGWAMLEQIEHGNLFLTPLDDERNWFRYHHLFGEMLRRQLQQSSPEIVIDLHHRASIWFEQNGFIAEAVEHALLEQEGEQAAQLVERYGESIWMRGELTTVLRWLKALPEPALRAHPKLGLTYAFILSLTDEFLEAEKRLLTVEQVLFQFEQETDDADHMALLGRAAAVRATVSLLRGYPGADTIAAGTQALAYLAESDLRWRGWANSIVGVAYFTSYGEMHESERYLKEAIHLSEQTKDAFTMMIGLSQLSRKYLIQGRLRQVEITNEQLMKQGIATSGRAQAQLDRALVRYERNELEAALHDVNEARRILDGYLLKRFSIDGCVILARLKWLQGDEAVAAQLMQQAVEIAQADNMRQTFVSEGAWQAWLWLKQGNFQAAGQWARDLEPTTTNQLNPAFEFEYMTVARIQMAQGQMDAAQALLERLFVAANSAGRMGRVIGICVLQALAFRLQGNTDDALNKLAYGLTLGEPEGFVRVFVDEGAPMVELLREAAARGIAAGYVTKLLAAFDDEVLPNRIASSHHPSASEYEALSERELEVLHLIVDGASNREIAQQLVISLGTVKKHINNIFLKLDAHSRTQATAIARKQHLL